MTSRQSSPRRLDAAHFDDDSPHPSHVPDADRVAGDASRPSAILMVLSLAMPALRRALRHLRVTPVAPLVCGHAQRPRVGGA